MHFQRIFGLLGMMASPLFLVYVLTTGMNETTLLGSTLGLLFQLGCLACAAGLFVTRATGDSVVSRAILVVQMTLHTLAAIFQVLEYNGIVQDSLIFTITDIAWPLGFLFMLVTGGAVIRARRVQGWQRYVALSCAFPLPVTMLSGALIGEDLSGYLFGVGLFVTYLLLAVTILRYNEEDDAVMVAQPSF